MRRTAPIALLSFVALAAFPAHAQVPAPVAPPGAAARPAPMPAPAPVAPAIPITPTAASPALPPPTIASAPPAQANPAAIPVNNPGALPSPAGIAAAVGGAVNAILEQPPAARRGPTDSEVEMTRPDYRAKLSACLEFRGNCNVRGLTRADQDYMRYELKGQRFSGMMLDEILEARMTQFGPELTIIAPSAKGNPDWHAAMRSGPQAEVGVDARSRARSSGYGMSRIEQQRVGGEVVKTRYVNWPKQVIPDRAGNASSRPDLD